MSTYWSVEECGWVEHVPEPVVAEAPEQRQPSDEEQVAPAPA